MFNYHFGLTRPQLYELQEEVLTGTFLSNIAKFFNEPSDNILSLKWFPFNVKTNFSGGDTTNIQIGTVRMSSVGSPLVRTNCVLSFSITNIPTKFNDFRDFSPYTSCELYLPFAGFINLDIDSIRGYSLRIEYVVSSNTGMSTINIYKYKGSDEYILISTTECKICVEIPIGGSNYNQTIKNVLTTGLSIATGIAVQKGMHMPKDAIKWTAVGSSIQGMLGQKLEYTGGSLGDSGNALFTSMYPTLFIKTPKAIEIENYNHYFGRPLMQNKKLNTLTGYTVIDTIHFEGETNANADELTEIERLLKSGIIL